MKRKVIDRFYKYVDKQGPYPVLTAYRLYPEIKRTRCWNWIGYCRGKYGAFGYKGKVYKAHRFSYRIDTGIKLSSTVQLLHKCANTFCVRPLHTYEGDHIQNMEDMRLQNRAASGDRNGSRLYPERLPHGADHFSYKHPEKVAHGERNRHAKLTVVEVKKIRKLWGTGKYFQRELAQQFNVLQTTIGRIVTNETWRFIA